MMDAIGIIYAADSGIELKEITRKRSIAAVPIAGRYRLIDFVLSNMVNSGIRNVGIITQNHYNSLMSHLGPGKEWDLNRKHDGLFILPPYGGNDSMGWYRGSVEALHSIMGYIRRSEQKYVIISGSSMVCNMTYNAALQFHKDSGADITVLYKDQNNLDDEDLRKKVLIKTHEGGKLCDMQVEPAIPKSTKMAMKMYIIEKEMLEFLVEECIARGYSDFIRDIIMKKLDSLKIFGYEFEGYLACIDSIAAYYRHSMEMLEPNIRNLLFFKSGLVYTRVKDEMPARYSENASVENCIVADGCILDGEVTNSVLFRGVKVYGGARIKNSIIMQDTEIHDDAIIENAILDKEVIIRKGKRLTGQENYPLVIGKGSVI